MNSREYLTLLEGFRGQAPEGVLYNGQEQFILRNSREYPEIRTQHEYPQGVMKACFFNSMQLALQHAELTYVEGYACSMLPLAHAWCIDSEDRVVDVTWREPGTNYLGVAFSAKYLRAQAEICARNNWWGLIDNPTQRWPLLTGKHTQFAAERIDNNPICC